MSNDAKPAAKPEPLIEGTFAIYEVPDGSMVMAYRRKGETKGEQIVVPAYVMAMVQKMTGDSGGNPLAMLSMLGG